jgi:NitT/TauT family transport system substrate-binding protein
MRVHKVEGGNSVVRKWLLRIGLPAALAIVALGLPGAGSAKQTAITVRFGYVINSGALPLFVCVEQGFCAKEGLDVVPTGLGSALQATAIASGSLDMGEMPNISMWQPALQGLPLRMLAPAWGYAKGTQGDFTRLGSTIRRPRDLEGHTSCTTTARGSQELQARAWIRNDGGDDTKVKFVTVPSTVTYQAILDGRCDNGPLLEPFFDEAKSHPDQFRFLGDDSVAIGPYGAPANSFVANSKFASANPQVMTAFVRAINASKQWIVTHVAKAKTFLPKYISGLTAEQAAAAPLYAYPMTYSAGLADLQNIAKVFIKFGFLGQINVKDYMLPASSAVIDKPASAPTGGKAKPVRSVRVTAKYNTLSKIAAWKLGSSAKWRALYTKNSAWFKSHNVSAASARTYRLPRGLVISY